MTIGNRRCCREIAPLAVFRQPDDELFRDLALGAHGHDGLICAPSYRVGGLGLFHHLDSRSHHRT